MDRQLASAKRAFQERRYLNRLVQTLKSIFDNFNVNKFIIPTTDLLSIRMTDREQKNKYI